MSSSGRPLADDDDDNDIQTGRYSPAAALNSR